VTPTGEDVPPGRQIVLQFDRAVVPIGRMERDASEVPITIDPRLECEWRWISTSALACQLGEDQALTPATRYTLTLSPELRAHDGSRLVSRQTHKFITQRPGVQYANFRTWHGPGMPEIFLNMNQPVEVDSIERHLFLRLPGGERVALTVSPHDVKNQANDLYWVAQPVRELPLDSRIHLEVEPGLQSKLGPEPSVESKTVVEFFTFPEHRFLGVTCRDNDGEEIRIPPDAWIRTRRACNPLNWVVLLFSSPVIKEVLRDHLTVEPDLAGGREDYDPWDNIHSYSRLSYPRRADQEYRMRLPSTLKARAEYSLKANADDIKDEFGRALAADIDITFETDNRPPLFVLTHPVSALETQVETHVPLVVTNLAEVRARYQRVMPDGWEQSTTTIPVEEAPNVAYRVPIKVRDWLRGRSGAVLASVDTTPPTKNHFNWFFSTVSPFQVHTKLGHRNTAVWVTDLESGLPVEGAQVRIYSGVISNLTAEPETLAKGITNAEGLAVLDGTTVLDPEIDFFHYGSLVGTRPSPDPLLFVRVDKDGEMALAPLSGDFSVRAEGPNNSWIPADYRRRYGHISTWGTTAQGVYRVGDTVQFKIYVRDQSNEKFVPAPSKSYTLQVHDPTDKLAHEVKELELNEFGSYSGEFKISDNGAVGWYSFGLTADFIDKTTWYPMRVLVADFTPAPFRVTTDINGELFRPGDDVLVGTSAKLHAGGPYADAQSRVTVSLRSTWLRPKDPKAESFFFETGPTRNENLHQSEESVDAQGELEQTITLPTSQIVYGSLRFESAVRDDRGKYVSGSATATYSGRDRYVGIRQTDWVLEGGEPSEVLAVVVDEAGNVAPGSAVTVRIEYRDTKASRVKGAGNAYLTQYVHNWVEVQSCQDTSGEDPLVCGFTPEKSGLYRLTASVTDTLGRSHSSTLKRWGVGKGRILWETPPGHHLPVEPEKSEYRVGNTARFLIRNPFPGGRALFTIERIGVQRSWTQVLENSSELIEFEVTADHLPGFYLSAVVTSPRVEAPLGDDQVDLGKPAFRMGYVRIPVRDPYKEIEVDIEPDKESYRPRETVRIELAAKPRHAVLTDNALPPMELAVAVLDEAVFDLIQGGQRYFDPYEGFYQLEQLDVQNYNLLTRLIGIQKFEKKGANPGGGGASGLDFRSVFKFVSYWNPSLRTDKEGRASIEFEVPDNLTGWRVLAMAVTRDDLMGLGQGTFVVNQPTELRPALPNQVTEGDHFDARFTVMNRTDFKRTLVVDASVAGPAESPGLESLRIETEPYKRYPVSFPVRTVDDGELVFTIRAGDIEDGDALAHRLKVRKRTALEAAANYGTTTEDEVIESILFPDGIRTDVGRVSVVTSPSVIGGVEGAFRYIRDYPYFCWEQKLTKGVMASHFARLRAYLPDGVNWEGHQTLPDATLGLAANYQAPNGGMVYYIPQDPYVSPYLSAYTALAFNWLRGRGHTIPAGVETKLHEYLQRLLRTDVFPDFYTKGMASSVRAVALAALSPSGKVSRSDLDRYRRHVPEMDLFGKSHYLQAAVALGADAELQEEVRNGILAHSSQSGGKFTFSESIDVGFKRILYSSVKSNCAILTSLVKQQGAAPTGTGIGDVPFKLTRSITQERKRRDRWENTQDNMFCMNALIDFSQVYETEAPDLTIRTYLDDEELGTTRFQDVRDTPAEVERPIRTGDPGREAAVRIERSGSGRLYYATRLFYTPVELKKDPINSGMVITREYSVERNGEWVLLEAPIRIQSGELVRVDLYVSLPAPRNFVVVDDPVPGGLEPVNRDLATASEVDAEKGDFQRSGSSYWFTYTDWREYGYSRWSFYHRELRHHAARFYSEYLPAGNYHLSYVAQAIAPGEFHIGPVHAEEMYDPDVFGQGVPAQLVVEPGQ
jgi:uncharacterized protein YfaS (alpha-2-macroglobulin family)